MQTFSLPSGRVTSALGFGCASLFQIPDASDRQYLLDLTVDLGIRHFDVARLYGLGLAEAELGNLLRRHDGKLSVATKFGLGNASPPVNIAKRQGGFRRFLKFAPGLRPLARRIYGKHMVPRDFSVSNCRFSIQTSLDQLGVETVDLLMLHEPNPFDSIDSGLEDCLQNLCREGLVAGYGISGMSTDILPLYDQRPELAPNLIQWEDDLFEPDPVNELTNEYLPQKSSFGLVRNSLPKILQAFKAVPQLQRYWSERLNLNLNESEAVVTAILGSALAGSTNNLVIFSTTNPKRLRRTLNLLHSSSWGLDDIESFGKFWRPCLLT